jgi:hypothetical protein|nr:MAG TPA: hypothetical protein [Caudoviricetes sp.]
MAKIRDYKVPDNALDSKKVQSLSNYPSRDGISATELKEFFDWPEIFISQFFNPLVELLQSGAIRSMGIEPYKDVTANNLLDFLKQLSDKRVVFKTENAHYIKVQTDGRIPYLMVSQDGYDWERIGHPNNDIMLKSDYVTGNNSVKVSETSKNSEKLGGQLPSYYETKEDGNSTRTAMVELTGRINQVSIDLSNKLGKTETAVNSNKLGGVPADQYARKDDIENSGGGDMLSSKYDSNKDGIVNKADIAITAESVQWDNVENKPTDLATNKTVETMVEPIGGRLSVVEGKVNSLQTNSDKPFDFDNILNKKYHKIQTYFPSSDEISETIYNNRNNKRVANRTTRFLPNGNIRKDVILYGDNGISVLETITSITEFKSDGRTIEEVIS